MVKSIVVIKKQYDLLQKHESLCCLVYRKVKKATSFAVFQYSRVHLNLGFNTYIRIDIFILVA